jgi:iron complex transport system substrate-binding protein
MNRQHPSPPPAKHPARPVHPTRRGLLGMGLGAGLALAGCTSAGSPQSGASQSATAPPSVGPSPSPRSVSTVMGAVSVPATPSRVVTLDTAELDSVLTLGLTPVGACRAPVDSGLLDYWASDRLSPVKEIGTIGKPDLKAIAALEPDLILSSKLRDGDHYEDLRKIAPTVFTESTGYPWKSNFHLHASALGLDDSANTVIDAYAAHTANVIDALGGKDKAGTHKVGVLRFVEGQPIRLYGRKSFVGSVLADVQVGRPGTQDDDVFATEITADRISETSGATVLFHAGYGSAEKSQQQAVTSSAAWRTLPAVQKHQAVPVDDQLWFLGIGYTGANELLSRLQYVLGG